jgi:CRP/FNR family transcriptional regulator, cyclic AMP receptor protein
MSSSQESSANQVKSGIRHLKPGEVIFNDRDHADSLFIIQKGQIRLYKPKGKGFVEIAVLRAGEVIGEMAYFDDDGSGRKRSCSAAAITPVEIIEISFAAFGKTMQSLNPWFKTIINTLVTRLRKANIRIKELEDNSATISYGNKQGGYEFMKPLEVTRILGTIFLVYKAHGQVQNQAIVVSRKTLNSYLHDLYQVMESKVDSILKILVDLGWMEIKEDASQLTQNLCLKNLENVRQIFTHYNTEKHLPDEKKIHVGDKCEMLISKMLEHDFEKLISDIPNLKTTGDAGAKFTKYYDVTPILIELKSKNINIGPDHTGDGKNIGLFGELIMKDNTTFLETDFSKVQKFYPVIRFVNAIRRSNEEKSHPS